MKVWTTLEKNPLTGKAWSPRFREILEGRSRLPAYRDRNKFTKLLAKHDCLVVVGETGSGKTTQLPQFVLAALHHAAGQKESPADKVLRVACTQPRRVAAVSVATRVAEEMDVALGDQVGYSIRFEHRASENTRLKYMTDGMLLREAMADPSLSAYKCIVLDEAHERTANTDILFGLVKRLLRERKGDLKVVVMSATLEHQRFRTFFDDAPLFLIEGRSYKVELHYARQPQRDYLETSVRTAVQLHVTEPAGDVLIFLTGAEEIHECCDQIQDAIDTLLADPDNARHVGPVLLIPLYSTLTPKQQQQIFSKAPSGEHGSGAPGRKIIVATNIAETSLTIDGIVYVIDCGFCKEKVYNPRVRVQSLAVTPISQASAQQRAGRAGRTREGKCYRLYTENHFRTQLQAQTYPEILRSNLCSVILLLKKLGVADLVRFEFLDPPAPEAMVRALEELHYLGALDDRGQLTDLGAQIVEFPVEPQLAKMIVSSPQHRCAEQVVSLAAMLSSPPVMMRPPDALGAAAATRAHARLSSPFGDHFTLVNILHAYMSVPRRDRDGWCHANLLNPRFLGGAYEVRRQLKEILARTMPLGSLESLTLTHPDFVPSFQRAILSGFFMQVAYLQRSGSFVTVKDLQPVSVHPSSFLKGRSDCNWVVFSEFVLTTQNYIRTCSPVPPEFFFEIAPTYFDLSTMTSPEVRRGLERAIADVQFRESMRKKRVDPDIKDIKDKKSKTDKKKKKSKKSKKDQKKATKKQRT